MARKVFMSVLGANFYDACTYVGKNSKMKTRFVQKAVLEDIGAKDWTGEDCAYIMLTNKAREDNWVGTNETRYNNKTQCDEHYERLEKVLGDTRLPCQVQDVSIPDGKNEDEMWQAFDTMFGLLQDGDELYFDLTHGYRYLPMLLLVLGNYAKFLKNVKVKYASYGNYEARYSADGEMFAPIMDLLPIVRLQDWAFAAGQFLRSGDADEICDLGSGQCIEIKRRIKRSDANVDGLNSYVRSLKTMADDLAFCRGLDVIKGDAIKSMRTSQERIKEETIPAFTPLISKITDSFISFEGKKCLLNSYYAAKWCLDKGLYQQAVTFLREGLVSYLCDKYEICMTDKKLRKLIDDIFEAQNPNNDKTISISDEDLVMYNRISSDAIFLDKEAVVDFCHLKDVRNDINHSGMNDSHRPVKTLKSNIELAVRKIGALFDSYKHKQDTNNIFEPVFINYSNHPASDWSQKQLSAAREFGEIVDIPFRSVAPEADSAELERVAVEELTKILEAASGKNAVVHLMGEMTLTYILVRKLKASGIRCVASTTARSVVENPDGTKTSDFDFVRFRDYE